MKCLTKAAKNPDSEGRVLHLKIKYPVHRHQDKWRINFRFVIQSDVINWIVQNYFSVKETLNCKLRGVKHVVSFSKKMHVSTFGIKIHLRKPH